MNLREKIARLVVPASGCRAPEPDDGEILPYRRDLHLGELSRLPDPVRIRCAAEHGRRDVADDPGPGGREGARVPRFRAVPRLVAVRVDPGRAADRGRFGARVGPLRGGRLVAVGADPRAEVDLPSGLVEHDGAGPWRPVPHPHGKGRAGEAGTGDGSARPDRRGGRGRADDREGDRRERLPGDGAGRVHRRRPGEDRYAHPRRESAGGPQPDHRHLSRNTTSTRSSSRSRPLRRRWSVTSWSIAAGCPPRSGSCPASAT